MVEEQTENIGNSLYTSKIRYGIQLLGKVRTEEDETAQTCLNKLQNKLAQFMGGKSLLDIIPTK
jgi:hypothetical protein